MATKTTNLLRTLSSTCLLLLKENGNLTQSQVKNLTIALEKALKECANPAEETVSTNSYKKYPEKVILRGASVAGTNGSYK